MATRGICREVDVNPSVTRSRAVPRSIRHALARKPFTGAGPTARVAPDVGRQAPGGASQRSMLVCSAAAVDSAPAAAATTLAGIPISAIINTQGMVLPEEPAGSLGAAFAIYDDKQKLQYVGTTTDLRNALRTSLGRRPEKAFYYKALSLPTADPDALLAVKDAWFSECGGQPNGNRLAMERAMWQQPVDGGAISERGRQGAAEERARQLIAELKQRGCKEEFTADPLLLAEGQVDFLLASNLSEEELAAQREAEAARMRGRRSCTCLVDGLERTFHTQYSLVYPTGGGTMLDVSVLFDGRETTHRVIVGRQYYEPFGLAPEAAAEAGLALLLRAKVARATEGMLLSSQFPVNYFALSQVEQWYGDEFLEEFNRITGGAVLKDSSSGFWRFSKTNDYGPLRLETAEQLQVSLGGVGPAPPAAAELEAAMGMARDAAGREGDFEDEDDEPTGSGILDLLLG